jgi:cyclic beta-1,2-glucan synthetase
VNYDAPTRSLCARNHWNSDFGDQVAFLTADREPHGLTADRSEFLGDEGDPGAPAALRRVGLSGNVGVGLDPCAALQVHLSVGPGEEVRTHFVLGAGRDADHAAQLARRWRQPTVVAEASQQLAAHCDALLSAVTVRTPEPAMDLLINRWALYRTLASRILARTGFYQSSGAFGFRDQLQDVLALLHCDPRRTRAHILECASRQFEEGDVLHWWHPPRGRGVRTRCSDDLLWLPYVTARYVEATGDLAVLEEDVPFLSAPPLKADEHDRYERFEQGDTRASLFEHCRRALEPWRGRAEELFETAHVEGWDGAWYRRAFDDEGTPWGAASSGECQIDSIAQSWAVLSGGAPREHAEQVLRSADATLIHESVDLACLLWPPFDLTARDPGHSRKERRSGQR